MSLLLVVLAPNSFLFLVASLVPSSENAPSSDARSP